MKTKKVYPYLMESSRMQGYYEMLLDYGYKVKLFDKKKQKVIYDILLPEIRNYMFWTFNLVKRDDFLLMTNDLKAGVCTAYQCNIFEKDKTIVVCFYTGICFAYSDDEEEVKSLKEYSERREMQVINLRDDKAYEIPEILKTEDYKEVNPYIYILELYIQIYLEKLSKAIQVPQKFDAVRNAFVEFTQSVFNVQITDDLKLKKIIEDLQEYLDINKKFIQLENEFDLLYKNNQMNDKRDTQRIFIIFFIIFIIIGMFNLWNQILY